MRKSSKSCLRDHLTRNNDSFNSSSAEEVSPIHKPGTKESIWKTGDNPEKKDTRLKSIFEGRKDNNPTVKNRCSLRVSKLVPPYHSFNIRARSGSSMQLHSPSTAINSEEKFYIHPDADYLSASGALLGVRVPHKELWLKCYLERMSLDKSNTKFTLYTSDERKAILTVIKRKKKNYLIFLGDNCSIMKNKNFVGKLGANFLGTEFCLLDNGSKPGYPYLKKNRRNICTISYVNSF